MRFPSTRIWIMASSLAGAAGLVPVAAAQSLKPATPAPVFTNPVPVVAAEPEAVPVVNQAQSYQSFADLRADVLNAIGGASKRIWLTTGYLSDGEIVSALYVAQYRKVQVHVLLGRAKANVYMSRLNYLKNQNIPVYLRPESFRPAAATSILCDDQLLAIDGELDFMTKYKNFTLKRETPAQASAYATAFAAAAELKLQAIAQPLPLVGRGRPAGQSQSRGVRPRGIEPNYDAQDGTGAYTYGRRPMPRPDGVPAKLPKVLKYEQRPTPPPVLKDDTDLDKGE